MKETLKEKYCGQIADWVVESAVDNLLHERIQVDACKLSAILKGTEEIRLGCMALAITAANNMQPVLVAKPAADALGHLASLIYRNGEKKKRL